MRPKEDVAKGSILALKNVGIAYRMFEGMGGFYGVKKSISNLTYGEQMVPSCL
jgi:hypothetical protein